jgi:uncharacterized protein YutE (UPF0331/DUF86 family)
MAESQVIRVFCSGQCSVVTNHSILKEIVDYDNEENYSSKAIYQIIKCGGCNYTHFRESLGYNELWEENGEYDERKITIYPIPKLRSKPDWLYQLDLKGIQAILEEVYIALSNEALTLAAAGIRTIVDLVAKDKEIKERKYQDKLKALVKDNYISESEKKLLTFIVDLGNASIHEAFKPDLKMITNALDSIEAILNKVYGHPNTIANLAKSNQLLNNKIPKKPNKISASEI